MAASAGVPVTHPSPRMSMLAMQDVGSNNPQCLIPLDNILVEADPGSRDTFGLRSAVPGASIKSAKKPRGRRGSFVQGGHSEFVLQAGSGRDRDAWVQALRLEVTRNPFVQLMDSKRRRAAAASSTMDPFAARLSRYVSHVRSPASAASGLHTAGYVPMLYPETKPCPIPLPPLPLLPLPGSPSPMWGDVAASSPWYPLGLQTAEAKA
jgi:hypothetical protein